MAGRVTMRERTQWHRVLIWGLGLLLAACTTAPVSEPAETERASAPSEPGLQPLSRQPAPPPGALARSYVATVDYDITVPGTGAGSGGAALDEGANVFERGGASWYGIQFHQRKTANGERFDMGAFTAAHRTLPFNTRVCVRSLVNGREVLVRINDRGPFVAGRIIDLSRAAADALGLTGLGIKQVALTLIDRNDMHCGGESVEPLPAAASAAPATRRAPALRKKRKR